jgi:hypothetical protein
MSLPVLTAKYLESLLVAFELFVATCASALMPLVIPAAIISIGSAFFGWSAPPYSLREIRLRYLRATQLFGLSLFAIACLFAAILPFIPQPTIVGLAIPWMIAMPLLACWLFGLAWRLGYDTGLLLAYVHAARHQTRTRRLRS